jgi:hypothetical protein
MSTRADRKQLRQKKRELRTARRELGRYNKKIKRSERKLDYLYQHRKWLVVSKDLGELLPDASPSDMQELEELQKVSDVFYKAHLKLSQNPPDPKWPGTKNFRHECESLQPFLSTLIFDPSYTRFTELNKETLWIGFCTEQSVRDDGVPPSQACKNWPGEVLHDAYDTFVQRLWSYCGWLKHGRAFRVTSLLTNTFSVADIPVAPGFLKLPFPFMLFEVPPRFTVIQEGGHKTHVSTILVAMDEQKGDDVALTLMCASSDSHAPAFVYSILFGESATIQGDIQLWVDTQTNYVPDDIKMTMKGTVEDAPYQIINFVCNVILYCASFPNDVTAHNEHKLKKLQERLEKQQRSGSGKTKDTGRKLQQARNDTILIVGKNFRLDDGRVSEELSHDDGRKLKVRHIVRGHWRNQACGPRHTERKLIFIQPFWKGRGKEGAAKTYVVK